MTTTGCQPKGDAGIRVIRQEYENRCRKMLPKPIMSMLRSSEKSRILRKRTEDVKNIVSV